MFICFSKDSNFLHLYISFLFYCLFVLFWFFFGGCVGRAGRAMSFVMQELILTTSASHGLELVI